MMSQYLIAGVTGSIGYAFTRTLPDDNIPTNILVCNTERAKKLFNDNTILKMLTDKVTIIK